MKYAVEMGSRAMIYIPSLIKIGSGVQILFGGTHAAHTHTDTQTHTEQGNLLSLLSYLKIRKPGQKYKGHEGRSATLELTTEKSVTRKVFIPTKYEDYIKL
jgi:hypothetical protein